MPHFLCRVFLVAQAIAAIVKHPSNVHRIIVHDYALILGVKCLESPKPEKVAKTGHAPLVTKVHRVISHSTLQIVRNSAYGQVVQTIVHRLHHFRALVNVSCMLNQFSKAMWPIAGHPTLYPMVIHGALGL